jgi:hypothetical protein
LSTLKWVVIMLCGRQGPRRETYEAAVADGRIAADHVATGGKWPFAATRPG